MAQWTRQQRGSGRSVTVDTAPKVGAVVIDPIMEPVISGICGSAGATGDPDGNGNPIRLQAGRRMAAAV